MEKNIKEISDPDKLAELLKEKLTHFRNNPVFGTKKDKETKQKTKSKAKTKDKKKKDKPKQINKQDKTQQPKKVKTEVQLSDAATDSTANRKWIEKGKSYKQTPYTPDEEAKIIDALCQYANENEIGEGEIINLITERQKKTDKSIWPKIAECLPDRSVQSIHNFCHRKFNPSNYKGQWTEEEVERLVSLYKNFGKKWERIGKELDRTATNVKDKFKQIGGENYGKKVSEFNLLYTLKLIKNIQTYLHSDDNETPYKILKCDYKFSSSLEQNENVLFKLYEEKEKFCIDSSLKDEKSKLIIKNILKLLLDFDVMSKILDKKLEISWSYVSEKMVFFSSEDCKNHWMKILREFGLDKKSEVRKDLKMIRK